MTQIRNDSLSTNVRVKNIRDRQTYYSFAQVSPMFPCRRGLYDYAIDRLNCEDIYIPQIVSDKK